MQKKVIRGILVGLVAFCVSFLVYSLKLSRELEWKSWDLRLRLFATPSQASKEIVLFLIDQYSLDLYEKQQGLPWPWPRQMYSAVIKYLQAGGAKVIFFDLILTEGSGFGVEDDRNFAEAMAKAGDVFLPIFISQKEKEIEATAPNLLSRFSIKAKGIQSKAIFRSTSITIPVENLLNSARGVGNVQFSPDRDGIYRRLPLLFSYKGLILPSLPLLVSGFVQGEKKVFSIPLDESGQMIVRYHGPTGTYKSYSIASIINSWALIEEGKPPQIPPQEFRGKIVLVGTSAPGILDLRPTPFSAVYPGVEIQATAIDNLLKGDFIRIPPRVFPTIFTLFFALFTAIGISCLRSIWKIVLFFILCLIFPAAAISLAFASGFWLEFVTPEFSVLMSFIGASLLNYSLEGRQRRFIKNVFRYYLSPEVIERIIKNPSLLRLGGEKREITSFFSDVAGFTSISEGLSPEDLVNLLNAYLSEMTEIILSSGGTLDKYEGDAIIAFWNAPLDQPDHALRACQAALTCQKRLKELTPSFRDRFGHELVMRIGLNSGPAVVGNMGSRKRFDYTAMGDTVNLASRLEGACKQYKVPILIGETTFEKIKEDIVSREVDIIRVVGKKKPVRIFEIFGEKGEIPSSELERIATFQQALEAYRNKEWEKALTFFQKLKDDILAQMYVSRCLSLKQIHSLEGWDGVFDLKEK